MRRAINSVVAEPVKSAEVDDPLVRISDARIHFPVRGTLFRRSSRVIRAVDGVSIDIEAGDSVGLVGESGSGKTTLVNAIAMLQPLTDGSIFLKQRDLSRLSRAQRKDMRRSVQIVFQDPFWSLNPRWLVRDIVGEPLRVQSRLRGNAYQEAVVKALEMVGLGAQDLFKYPHEFSGGMRQRIAITRALTLEPDLVVLDEPTSAVDVISQHRILLMLDRLRERLGLTYIVVSHDLSVVAYLASKTAVMYAGRLVEYGPTRAVYDSPLHPYTKALLDSVPDPSITGIEALGILPGSVPSALEPPSGCRFHPRCGRASAVCGNDEPPRKDAGVGHYAYCWHAA